jgi:archaemetzincin
MKLPSLIFTIATALMGCVSRENRIPIIAIQPLSGVSQQYIDTVRSSIQRVYGFKTFVLPARQIPKRFEVNIKTPRYRADSIISYYKKHKPDSIAIILALTEKDISVTKRDWLGRIKEPKEKYTDWGVFGYGYVPGPSCVVSTFRLKSKPEKTFARLTKVALHEVGHNLGLPHCENINCVMRDAAESIKTVDDVKAQLCERCSKKIN